MESIDNKTGNKDSKGEKQRCKRWREGTTEIESNGFRGEWDRQ